MHITECHIYSSKGSVKFLYSCSSQEDSRLNSMILVQHEPIGYNLMDAGSVQIIMFTMTKENLKRPFGLIWGWSNRWIWLLIILFGVSQYCSLIYNAFYTTWSTVSNNPSKRHNRTDLWRLTVSLKITSCWLENETFSWKWHSHSKTHQADLLIRTYGTQKF